MENIQSHIIGSYFKPTGNTLPAGSHFKVTIHPFASAASGSKKRKNASQQAFYIGSLSECTPLAMCSGQQRHIKSMSPVIRDAMALQLQFSVGDYSSAHSHHTGSFTNENKFIIKDSACFTFLTMMSQISSPLISS